MRNSVPNIGVLGVCLATSITLMLGCSDKASEVQCDQAYNHLIEVRTGGEPEIVRKIKGSELEKSRPAFLEECVGRTSKTVIECWLSAQTTEEMRKCEAAR